MLHSSCRVLFGRIIFAGCRLQLKSPVVYDLSLKSRIFCDITLESGVSQIDNNQYTLKTSAKDIHRVDAFAKAEISGDNNSVSSFQKSSFIRTVFNYCTPVCTFHNDVLMRFVTNYLKLTVI